MNEKNYKKRLDFQEKLLSKKTEEIESLKLENERLKLIIEEKEEVINSVSFLKDELTKNVDEIKAYKKQYESLVKELKDMKKIMNQEVFKGRWKLIRFLIK